MTLDQIFDQLKADPRRFLAENVLTAAVPEKGGGDYRLHRGGVGYRIDNVPYGDEKSLRSPSLVPMIQVHGGNATTDLVPVRLVAAGDSVMVTGVLTGCVFCWLPDGDDLYCAHVQPVKDSLDARALQQQLGDPTTGSFAGRPGRLNTFGRKNHDMNDATVIGFHDGKTWKLFAQARDGDQKVRCVWTLHPHWSICPV